jgi:Tol biopolymer transport system component
VKLLTTRVEEPRLFWANATNLALLSRRADRPGYDLTLVSPDGTLRTLLTNKENLDVLWSPDGKYLLYSYFSSEAGTTLWLRSLEAGDEVNLGIYTSALKCAWHPVGLAVTCGIPVQKSLNGDVPADQSASIDDVLTYDFEANTLRSVYNGVRSSLVGVTKPLVSSSGKYFVFTNMFDSRLYMLPLQ